MSLENLLRSKERCLVLLCLIAGLLVLEPILNRFVAARIFLDIFLTAIVILMAYIISNKRSFLIAGFFLAIVMLASLWLQYTNPNMFLAAICMVAGIFLIALVIANLLGFVLKSTDVNREVIYTAILLYLLAALFWTFVYAFLEIVDPISFNVELSQPKDYLLEFQYYSFVTITTLGYGDITPVTEVAKAFSVFEAVVGQIYLVVAVAWLVGMHVSKKSKS